MKPARMTNAEYGRILAESVMGPLSSLPPETSRRQIALDFWVAAKRRAMIERVIMGELGCKIEAVPDEDHLDRE